MKIKIEINCDSEAMVEGGLQELQRVLIQIADVADWETIEQLDGKGIRDYNGNTIGIVRVKK